MNAFPLNIEKLIDIYGFNGEFFDVEVITNGHVNNTYAISFKTEYGILKYLLQQINTNVFKNPLELMNNIIGVTSFLKNKIKLKNGDADRETLSVVLTRDGKPCFMDEDGNWWRCYKYIEGTYTCNIIENPTLFYNSAKSFGEFQNMLSDYPIETLYEIIPNFHNTYSRYQDLLLAVKEDKAQRAKNVKDEIDFVLSRENDTKVLLDLIDKGELPIRVTHNDTKLNNILFDNETNEGICIIDLDTVMPGLSLYDFGDSIRFGASTAQEDEKDLSKVSISLELFKVYVEGYLSSAKSSLIPAEIENLAFSAKLITFEVGIRFLTDHLNGDIYFKTDYPDHNLDRCRTQFKLVSDMENKMDEMNNIVHKAIEGDLC